MKLTFDLILSSPLTRARETAEIVAAELKCQRRLCFSDNLRPRGNPGKLVAELNAMEAAPENVLLVGHEPDLSRLISLVVTGRPDAAFDLKKGGLARLEAEQLRAGKCATLVWLLTPKLMRQMT
jgi:phosphohistidine phosphatase